MEKKNVTISLDVEDIYTKEVKQDSKKGGKIYISKDLVGRKVVVMSLKKNGKKKRVTNRHRCEVCGKQLAITIPPYQRLNQIDDICFCDLDDPIIQGIFKRFSDDPRVKKIQLRISKNAKP